MAQSAMAIRDPHTASPFPYTPSSPLQAHPQRLRRIRTHLAVNCQPFSPLKSHYRIAGVDAEYVVCTFGAEAGIGEGVLYFAYFGGNHHGVGVAVNDGLGRGYNHRGRLGVIYAWYQDAIIPPAVGEGILYHAPFGAFGLYGAAFAVRENDVSAKVGGGCAQHGGANDADGFFGGYDNAFGLCVVSP